MSITRGCTPKQRHDDGKQRDYCIPINEESRGLGLSPAGEDFVVKKMDGLC